MKLQKIDGSFSVCKLDPRSLFDALRFAEERSNDASQNGLFFLAGTGDELSLVCPAAFVPVGATAREDGFTAFRVAGTLDFSLIGILSKLTGILAKKEIGVFVVSTFDTDYILVRETNFPEAAQALSEEGYQWELPQSRK